MKIFKKITIVSILLIIMLTYAQTLVFAAESELTLTPKPETNNIHLKWTGPQNSSYKVYQKKPGASAFETIGLTDFSADAIDEEVKVLNIYPINTTEYGGIPNVDIQYLDGQTENVPKSALLKVWMEGGTVTEGSTVTNFRAYGKNPATGRQIIKVTHVSTREFEANPNMIWDYDVMMHGTWDSNAKDQISRPAVEVIGRYIDAGKGALLGHDTIGYRMGKEYGTGLLAERFNLFIGNYVAPVPLTRFDSPTAWHYGSSKVKINKKGFLTQYPWNLGPVGTVLNVPFSHTTCNAAKDNTWMEFVDGSYYPREIFGGIDVATTDEEARAKLPSNINIKYYLTTWNNTAMIQTGHSSGQSTEDERKVLANTLFYLKQLTKKTEILDNSARDLENPNNPVNITTAVNEDNTTNIRFRRPEDNGSTYEYYVKGLDGARDFTSDTKSATITTGVKRYKYIIDESPENPSKEQIIEMAVDHETKGENELIPIENISFTGAPKYIHIYSVDGAGNESEVYTQKLEKPNAQEIEITKEVVNGKNEYKIGDRVTYNVKAKIKENITNKGKITNVNIVDTYNNNYLRLVNGSIVKDNNTVVNTDEVGKIKTTINELVYGNIKEIRYDMEVLNAANR